MRLSQYYSDQHARSTSVVSYLATEAGAPSDNATRLGISTAKVRPPAHP